MGKPRLLLTSITIGALALRLAAVFAIRHYLSPVGSEYEELATNLVEGRGYVLAPYFGLGYPQDTSWTAPIYPLFMALAFYLGGVARPEAFLGMELFQTVVGALLCPVIYLIGRKTFGNRVAILAAILTAVYPVLIYAVTQDRPVAFITLLLAVQVLLAMRARASASAGNVLLLGATAGVLALLEPVSLLFSTFLIFWVPAKLPRPWGGRMALAGLGLASVLVILLPWTVRNYAVHQRLVLVKSSLGYQLWSGNNPNATGTLRLLETAPDSGSVEAGALETTESRLWLEKQRAELVASQMPGDLRQRLRELPEAEGDALLTREALAFMASRPGEAARLAATKLYYFWWFDPSNPLADTLPYRLPWMVALPLAVLGLILSRHLWRKLLPIYVLFPVFTLPYVVSVIEARFRIPLEPFVLLFAAKVIFDGLETVLPMLPGSRALETGHGASPD